MKLHAEDYRILYAALYAALNDDQDPWLALPTDLVDRAEELLVNMCDLVEDYDDDVFDEDG